MLFALHVLDEIIPAGSLHVIACERNHRECLAGLRITRTNISTVAASEAVQYAWLDHEVHTFHGCRSLHLDRIAIVTLDLLVIQNERTDDSVRTYVSTLVTDR